MQHQIERGTVRDLTEDYVRSVFKKYAIRRACCTSVDRGGLMLVLDELALPRTAVSEFDSALEKHKGSLKIAPFLKVLRKRYGLFRVEADTSQLKRAFDKLDTNHDGYIDFKEMQQGVKAMRLQPKDAPIMMKAADVNHDNRVDFQEFLRVIGYRTSTSHRDSKEKRCCHSKKQSRE